MRSILLLALWIGIGRLIRGIPQTLAAASDNEMPASGRQIFLGALAFVAGIVSASRAAPDRWRARSGRALCSERAYPAPGVLNSGRVGGRGSP